MSLVNDQKTKKSAWGGGAKGTYIETQPGKLQISLVHRKRSFLLDRVCLGRTHAYDSTPSEPEVNGEESRSARRQPTRIWRLSRSPCRTIRLWGFIYFCRCNWAGLTPVLVFKYSFSFFRGQPSQKTTPSPLLHFTDGEREEGRWAASRAGQRRAAAFPLLASLGKRTEQVGCSIGLVKARPLI